MEPKVRRILEKIEKVAHLEQSRFTYELFQTGYVSETGGELGNNDWDDIIPLTPPAD